MSAFHTRAGIAHTASQHRTSAVCSSRCRSPLPSATAAAPGRPVADSPAGAPPCRRRRLRRHARRHMATRRRRATGGSTRSFLSRAALVASTQLLLLQPASNRAYRRCLRATARRRARFSFSGVTPVAPPSSGVIVSPRTDLSPPVSGASAPLPAVVPLPPGAELPGAVGAELSCNSCNSLNG